MNHSQWSQVHTVEIASFHRRRSSAGLPLQYIALFSVRRERLPCSIQKTDTPKGCLFFRMEHREVEPLTSTMRMSRATNCANAPYMTTGKLRCSLPRFTSAGLETAQSFDCVRKYITVERKRQGIFDGGGCFRYNPGSR